MGQAKVAAKGIFHRPGKTILFQLRMTAVAERFGIAVFATAPGDLFAFLDLNIHGRKPAAFMGAITERLLVGFATGAPVIISRLHFLNKRSLFSNDRFRHVIFLFLSQWLMSNQK
jgi:hypothetical protein